MVAGIGEAMASVFEINHEIGYGIAGFVWRDWLPNRRAAAKQSFELQLNPASVLARYVRSDCLQSWNHLAPSSSYRNKVFDSPIRSFLPFVDSRTPRP